MLRLKESIDEKPEISKATITCPVFVGVVSSLLKSITSRPNAASFKVPASNPNMRVKRNLRACRKAR